MFENMGQAPSSQSLPLLFAQGSVRNRPAHAESSVAKKTFIVALVYVLGRQEDDDEALCEACVYVQLKRRRGSCAAGMMTNYKTNNNRRQTRCERAMREVGY
jgi:hypothetical protein